MVQPIHKKVGSNQKMPISDFQSQFLMSKIIRIFLNFLGACFLWLTFFENINFYSIFFTKIMPIFWLLNLECTLIYQKYFFIKKSYLPLNLAPIWCRSCWKILKWYQLVNKPFMFFWWICWVPPTTLVFICFRSSNFGLDMVKLSLMKVVISAFSVVSKVSEDSSFKLIDVVVSISSVVSLVAHQFRRVEFRILYVYTRHYNPLLIWNCSQL
jgi:hypothetical protein